MFVYLRWIGPPMFYLLPVNVNKVKKDREIRPEWLDVCCKRTIQIEAVIYQVSMWCCMVIQYNAGCVNGRKMHCRPSKVCGSFNLFSQTCFHNKSGTHVLY